MPLQLRRVWFAEKDVENGLVWGKGGRSNKAHGPEEVLAAVAWAGEGRRKYAILEDMDLLGGKCKQMANLRNPDTFPLYLYKQTLPTDMRYSKKAHMENKRDSLVPHFFFWKIFLLFLAVLFFQSQWFPKQILRYQQRSDSTYVFLSEPIDFIIQQTASLISSYCNALENLSVQ